MNFDLQRDAKKKLLPVAHCGFDLMQTDRVLEAALFLKKTGRRSRS